MNAQVAYCVFGRLHGDFAIVFGLNLSRDEAFLIVPQPARLLNVIGLVHDLHLFFFQGSQERHGVHIVPTLTFVGTWHRGSVPLHPHQPVRRDTTHTAASEEIQNEDHL